MLAAIFVDTLLRLLDEEFSKLHARSLSLLEGTRDEDIYRSFESGPVGLIGVNIGEYVLRSAAIVEQAAGGITTRLWDDPFEWTLPEKLSTRRSIIEYLDEVEQTRRRAFDAIASDADLSRQIPSPERLRSLFQILVDAAVRASHFQGRAFALHQTLTGTKPPGI